MPGRLVVFLVVGVSLVFGLLVGREFWLVGKRPHPDYSPGKLNILTYQSLGGSHGPLEAIVNRFERDAGVKVKVTALGDAGLMLERLKLQPELFDVVVGLDTLVLSRAQREFSWAPIHVDPDEPWLPEARALNLDAFSVISWSPLTFIYREDGQPVPQSFGDLANEKFRAEITVEDPRVSAPGAQFLAWATALGKAQGWFELFRPNVFRVAPTWTFAYGLFEKRQTRFVFSYLTSLSYHWGIAHDRNFRALSFGEGHPRAADFVAVPMGAQNLGVAQSFVKALHQDWAQRLIMQKNFMFPIRAGLTEGTIFAELPHLKVIDVPGVPALEPALKSWEKVFAH